MSGPQHIAWFETSERELGRAKIDALDIRMARSDQGFDAVQLRDALIEMTKGINRG